MTREKIEDLLDRYNSGNVTEEEKALVEVGTTVLSPLHPALIVNI